MANYDDGADDLAGTASRSVWRDVVDNSDDEHPLTEALLYLPPWRLRLADSGELGPEYGPDSAGAIHRMYEEWSTRRASGSLWDDDLGRHPSIMKRQTTNDATRYDSAEALAFLRAHGATLPTREAQAVTWFYSGKSVGRIATDLGVKQPTVRTYIQRFRERMRGANGCK